MNNLKKLLPASIKRFAKVLLDKDYYPAIDISKPLCRFGSEYGGWWIDSSRIGQNSVIYSFGIGTDISFDQELIGKFHCTVHGFDPTPQTKEYLAVIGHPSQFHFHEIGIAGKTGSIYLHRPKNPNFGSCSILTGHEFSSDGFHAEVHNLRDIAKNLGHGFIDIVKMDIEGAEYDVIVDMDQNGFPPMSQLLIEFHHRFSSIGLDRTKHAVNTLKRLGFCLAMVSANGEEYTFINRNAS